METPFYAESGGQVGDKGVIISPQAKITVNDTKKIGGLHSHRIEVTEGVIRERDRVLQRLM